MNSLKVYNNNRGVALLIALLMSVAIMALVAGVLYFITQSTTMSGAGKRYATAAEASDGAVEAMKSSIYLVFHGNAVPNVFNDPGNCLTNAIQQCSGQPCQGNTCQVTTNLPGISGDYTANVSVQRLYTVPIPGGRLEFAKSAGGAPSTAVFYRITTNVIIGPNNTTADNAALYRLMD